MIKFFKYSAAGNDFIIIDNRQSVKNFTAAGIRRWCRRHFGIGADGILLLENCPEADYRMVYFNADGSRGEMCGNGARALCAFAQARQSAPAKGRFLADDGFHRYYTDTGRIWIEIQVNPAQPAVTLEGQAGILLNTGVPHLVLPFEDLSSAPVQELGYRLSRRSPACPDGANVNFLEYTKQQARVRTFERGVDAETLACGTGAAACATYLHHARQVKWPIGLTFPGGLLTVDYRDETTWLTGPVELTFEGYLSSHSL